MARQRGSGQVFRFINDGKLHDRSGLFRRWGHAQLVLNVLKKTPTICTSNEVVAALDRHRDFRSDQPTYDVVKWWLHKFKLAGIIEVVEDV